MSKVKQNLPIIQQAKQYFDEGFSIIPCHQNKRPAISSWAKYQEVRMSFSQLSEHFTSAVGIGVIAGKVSNGLFFVDFDNKLKNAEVNLKKITGSLSFKQIMGEQPTVIASTQSGGFHLYFKITGDDAIPGSTKLAYEYDADGNQETSIETRGEGSYVLAPKTPGYQFISGSGEVIPELSILQLQAILDICKQLDAIPPATSKAETVTSTATATAPAPTSSTTKSGDASPGRKNIFKKLVNEKYGWMAYKLLLDAGWTQTPGNDKTKLTRPGKNPEEGCSATFGYKGSPVFYCFSDSTGTFNPNKSYTVFEVICVLEFGGNHKAGLAYFANKCGIKEGASQYIRVGDDYFQIYSQKNQFGTKLERLTPRKEKTIVRDYTPLVLKQIPTYIGFINEPDNVNYQRVIDGSFYNISRPFPHKPVEGNCDSTLGFIKHVFGDEQYQLGLDYLQLLYLSPKQRLPTLVIVSEARETGKTTFLEYLNNLMVSQAIIMDSDTLDSQFNLSFGFKSILMVDEALIRSTKVLEKLKRLATAKTLSINEKFQSRFDIPFYGKLILAGNREEDLINIDKAETRYWVLKLLKPPEDKVGLAQRLVDEIPAFLHFLQNREMEIKSPQSRLYFPAALTKTQQGNVVKNASISPISHDIRHRLYGMFTDNAELDEIKLASVDVKDGWFANNHQVGTEMIKRLINKDFGLKTIKNTSYKCLLIKDKFFSKETGFETIHERKSGTPFCFKREDFCDKKGNMIGFPD